MDRLGDVLPLWSVAPFGGLLLSIALLPQLAEGFWHSLRNQLLVAVGWAAPVLALLGWLTVSSGDAGPLHALEHALLEYGAFIVLLGSLFVISGGIHIEGDLPARPWVNTTFLAVGAVLANVVGTTGASMLLIRPLLRTNSERNNTWHVPLFFIFVVSNVGGALTPIGDPPLFLGYLRGVPFGWTVANLWVDWLVAVGMLLATFFALDTYLYRYESPERIQLDLRRIEPLSVIGRGNFALLGLVIVAILALTPDADVPDFRQYHAREIALIALAAISLATTPNRARVANAFSWEPILEVAALFVGIFVTMIPATALLETHGGALGLTHPWQYFWASGLLSSFLDNAPTYVTFAAMACGSFPEVCPSAADLGSLTTHPESAAILRAISLGAVFMGANSYIGNGPNFMVKAIAVRGGYPMPSFFAYCGWAALFLSPVYVVITVFGLR
ncbi:MAG: sodium:proton antiporter [Myxococcota bacterium]